jgi:hypothetical protein
MNQYIDFAAMHSQSSSTTAPPIKAASASAAPPTDHDSNITHATLRQRGAVRSLASPAPAGLVRVSK